LILQGALCATRITHRRLTTLLGRYRETGLVLWPDYWKPTVAPDMYRIAPEATPPNGTVESGQIVINKRKCWKALLLALFLNCQGSLYFNLLTNYMGVGDKETFAFAMRMLQMVRPIRYVVDAIASANALLCSPTTRSGMTTR
jgi:alpha 1,2-mannosyltransferase